MAERATLSERFNRRVILDGPVPEHRPELGRCHLWRGAHNPQGYPRMHIRVDQNGRQIMGYAHRVALELDGVDLGDDLLACHHCDNPGCVRRSHLFAGSPKDNMADASAKGRMMSRRKLTPELVTWVRLRAARGESVKAIAEELGFTQGGLSCAVRGKTWSRLPLPQELVDFYRRKSTHCGNGHERAVHGYKAGGSWRCHLCEAFKERRRRAKDKVGSQRT